MSSYIDSLKLINKTATLKDGRKGQILGTINSIDNLCNFKILKVNIADIGEVNLEEIIKLEDE